MPRVHPVKVALARRGETTAHAARAIGYSPGSTYLILNGHIASWPEMRRRWSEYLGIAEADLFPDSGLLDVHPAAKP